MDLMIFAPIGAAAALLFVAFLTGKVKKFDEGTDSMKKLALSIRNGAMAYLKRQYKGVAMFFAVMFVVLLGLSFA